MKNVFKIPFITLLLLVVISCSKESKKEFFNKGKAVIAGKVINCDGEAKAIAFSGSSILQPIRSTALIDSLGNFRVEVELTNAQNIQLYFQQGVAILYVQPSDSLFLELDELLFNKNQFPSFHVSGTVSSANVTNDICLYMQAKELLEPFQPDYSAANVSVFHNILKKEIVRQDSILLSYCNNHKVTDEFRTWAAKEATYTIANELVSYSFFNRDYKGSLFNESLFPTDDDCAIVYSGYYTHLKNYVFNSVLLRDSINNDLYQKGNYNQAYSKALNKVVTTCNKGLSRDIMCFNLLNTLYNDSFKDYVLILNSVENYIESPFLTNELKLKKQNREKQASLNIAYLDQTNKEPKEVTGDFWEELKDKYRNKVIYVDLWSTSCGPCIGEIPASIELHELFKGKDIVFVNLCLGSDKTDWQKIIANTNFSGEHYLLSSYQSQLLQGKLKYEGTPTYLIIDKQGLLINNNAPRPSSGDKIKSLLNNEIEKHSV